MDLAQATGYLRELEAAHADCIANGPGPSGTNVAACHYVSRAPYVAQRVEELSREKLRGNRTTTTT
eukprot:scaffold53260_cov87-Phaeocystis_antarctica.AAC.1